MRRDMCECPPLAPEPSPTAQRMQPARPATMTQLQRSGWSLPPSVRAESAANCASASRWLCIELTVSFNTELTSR
jgi:hypothetical protein